MTQRSHERRVKRAAIRASDPRDHPVARQPSSIQSGARIGRQANDSNASLRRYQKMNYAPDNALRILKKSPNLRHCPPTCCPNATEQFHIVAIWNRCRSAQPLQPIQNAAAPERPAGATDEWPRRSYLLRLRAFASDCSASDATRGGTLRLPSTSPDRRRRNRSSAAINRRQIGARDFSARARAAASIAARTITTSFEGPTSSFFSHARCATARPNRASRPTFRPPAALPRCASAIAAL